MDGRVWSYRRFGQPKRSCPLHRQFLCTVLVAGMTRHVLATSGVDTVGKGVLTGVGLGLFVVTPWIATNVMFAQRDRGLI